MVTVIDAKGHVMGRLASNIAERILNGEEIVILNAESVVITGAKEMVFAEFKAKVDRGQIRKGPYYPRRADLLLKRTIRGMIPWTTTSGREAYRRVHVFVGSPEQFNDVEKQTVDEAMRLRTGKYTTLGAVAKFLGSNVR
ncbi:MAG: 50S ribosomal protein L13 [Methanomassiliicoccaceae archaeon]|jgi:large subunit ribosomal protein L13|nr:50S ribosomal protein L13 [Methanomassiliicoccaceae archaeon]